LNTFRTEKSLTTIAQALFTFARSQAGAWIIGWSFAYMHMFLPVHRVHETDLVMAFYHPKPSHPVHILIVPKRPIRSILEIDKAHTPILQEVIAVAQEVVRQLALEAKGFRLIVNGGAYQDVMQVHWHLISDG
jgi:histidine triad (HIT) family protein